MDRLRLIVALRVDERLLLMAIGVLVGAFSGLAAVALTRSIDLLTDALEPVRHTPWALFVPGVGAAAAAFFLSRMMHEEPGHGVPEVIFSVSRTGGRLRARSSFSRLVSSCLTLGSGGSAGPEAPVVMSGSAIGSSIARALALNERQRVVLVGCGAAGAIASIFNAPIAGMVFSLEVILGAWSRVSIAPIAIAAVTGAEVSRYLRGSQVPFGPATFAVGAGDMLAALGLAVVAAFVSLLLSFLVRVSHDRWDRLPLPIWARALAGGCLVGAIGLAFPVVLGEGYLTVREAIGGTASVGLVAVACAVLMKSVATSLTIGSGGSGGIFAPCLVVGSQLGLTYHRVLCLLLPTTTFVPEGCFALLGMAGLVSGILQAPLTGIFLIIEITGGWSVILPLIVVAVVAATVCQKVEPGSFYVKDLKSKGHLLREGTDARVLADMQVSELLETDCLPVHEDTRLGELVGLVTRSRRNYFPVLERASGRFVGLLHLDDVRELLFERELYDAVLVAELMSPSLATVTADDSLETVLERMDNDGSFSLPVVKDGRFLGMISKASLLDRYRRELIVQTDE